jgi:hypothetical protein
VGTCIGRLAVRPSSPARHRIVLAFCGLPSTAHIDQLLDERIRTNGRACAVRMEAAALRRDIKGADSPRSAITPLPERQQTQRTASSYVKRQRPGRTLRPAASSCAACAWPASSIGSHTPTTTPSPPTASASPSPTPRSTTDCSFHLPRPTSRKHPTSSAKRYAPSTTTSMTTSPGHASSPHSET